MDIQTLESARGVAYRYLGYAARSQAEIARRLEKADTPPEIILHIIEEMTAAGFLDDEAFAQAWVADRADRKKYGKTRLAAELQRRGVAKETVQEALSTVDEEAEKGRALAAVQGKWRVERFELLDFAAKQAEQRKIAQFLQRRGFGWAIIKQVLAEWMENREGTL